MPPFWFMVRETKRRTYLTYPVQAGVASEPPRALAPPPIRPGLMVLFIGGVPPIKVPQKSTSPNGVGRNRLGYPPIMGCKMEVKWGRPPIKSTFMGGGMGGSPPNKKYLYGGGGGRGEKTYILQCPAFDTFIPFLTGDRSRPTPVRVAIKSNHDILPGLHHYFRLI